MSYINPSSGIFDPKDFLSKGRATPFAGWQVNGKCIATICDGKLVYAAPETHTAK